MPGRVFNSSASSSLAAIVAIVVGVAATRAGIAAVAEDPVTRAIVARPLAPIPPRSSPTLFITLAPESTGISAINSYDDPRMWTDRFEVFAYGAIGTGVAIGDYDGDGRPDVFVVRKTGTNRLFRNLGDFRFEDVTDAAGVGGPVDAWNTGAAFVDVNNDGRLDLYVCRIAAANLLFLNNGDGKFAERGRESGLGLVDASGMAAFCDYDRDGWLDCYIVTNLLDHVLPFSLRS
jgi:hypothetical protein